ncbi:substrate-binding domain-containing protein [Streptomyces sp. NPDC005803]|uniref:substrate-binding domain-containing protein n=1 Tax=Streptomyces sp. NPDC005803 TaxID=3154297 RepID=UPI0033F7544D
MRNESPIGPLLSLLRTSGRIVPEDATVIALCPEPLAEQHSPRLTAVTGPARELGSRAGPAGDGKAVRTPHRGGHPARPRAYCSRELRSSQARVNASTHTSPTGSSRRTSSNAGSAPHGTGRRSCLARSR